MSQLISQKKVRKESVKSGQQCVLKRKATLLYPHTPYRKKRTYYWENKPKKKNVYDISRVVECSLAFNGNK